MADLSDVEEAMVATIAGALGLGNSYLDGALSVYAHAGVKCRVFRGWPESGALDADLAAGIADISVFPVPRGTRNMTRHLFKWRPGPPVTPTLTAVVSGNTVTFDGICSVGQVTGVAFGPSGGSSQAYSYRLTTSDTPITVASELASRIPGASASWNVLTVPTNYDLVARVGADQPMWLETRRQEQQIWVIGWCPSPAARDAVMSAIDAGFANMQDQYGRYSNQFAMPDGSNAVFRYVNTSTDDAPQQASLWRRDLRYRIEYPTTVVQMQPVALWIGGYITNGGPPTCWGDVSTSEPQDDQTLNAFATVAVTAGLSVTQDSNALSDIAALNVTQDDQTLAVDFAIGVGRIGNDFIG